MNKYEKALKEIHKDAYPNACECWSAEHYFDNYKILQELVERATPMKPYLWYENNNKLFDCPKCKTTIEYINDFTEHKFCLNCGQALDWSD